MAQKRVLTSRIGDAFIHTFLAVDTAGDPFDMTGYTVEFIVLDKEGGDELVSILNADSELTFVAASGSMALTVTHTSEWWKKELAKGKTRNYELNVTNAAGNKTTWVCGEFLRYIAGRPDDDSSVGTTVTVNTSGVSTTVTVGVSLAVTSLVTYEQLASNGDIGEVAGTVLAGDGVGTGLTGLNYFSTINAPNGTDPVASGHNQTLNLADGNAITITGVSGTDTITVAVDDNFLLNTGDSGVGDYDFTVTNQLEITHLTGPGTLRITSERQDLNVDATPLPIGDIDFYIPQSGFERVGARIRAITKQTAPYVDEDEPTSADIAFYSDNDSGTLIEKMRLSGGSSGSQLSFGGGSTSLRGDLTNVNTVNAQTIYLGTDNTDIGRITLYGDNASDSYISFQDGVAGGPEVNLVWDDSEKDFVIHHHDADPVTVHTDILRYDSSAGLNLMGIGLTVTGTVTGTSFTGAGTGLTSLPAALIAAHSDVAASTTHRGLVSGNPHVVTHTEVGSATAQWNADKILGVPINASPTDTYVLAYDSTGGVMEWVANAGGGGGGDTWKTITPTSGSPVVASGTDSLVLTEGAGLTISGDGTDTITFSVDDDYLLNTGDTGVGNYTFTGDVTVGNASTAVLYIHSDTDESGSNVDSEIRFLIDDGAATKGLIKYDQSEDAVTVGYGTGNQLKVTSAGLVTASTGLTVTTGTLTAPDATLTGNVTTNGVIIDLSGTVSGDDNYVMTLDWNGGTPTIGLEASAGGGANSWTTFTTDAGTSPTAGSSETIIFEGGAHITTTGTSGTDKVSWAVDDDFLLNDGDTGVGNYTIQGITSLRHGLNALSVGADVGAFTTVSDTTDKSAHITAPHYLNAEQDSMLVFGDNNVSSNFVTIGGGHGSYNAATRVRIFTGATNATVTGTERLRVSSSGLVSMFGAATVSGLLTASASLNVTGTATATDFAGLGTGITGFTPTDANQIMDGVPLEKQDVSTIVNGSNIYAVVEKNGGGNLPCQFANVSIDLDCTAVTDTPTLGHNKARVALVLGTVGAPALNYIYVTESGGTLTLVASTTEPSGAHAMIATASVETAAAYTTRETASGTGNIKLQRWTDSYINDSNGRISHIMDWIRQQPGTWISGCAGTTDVVDTTIDTINFTAAVGVVRQAHSQTWATKNVQAHGVMVLNDGTTPYRLASDLNGDTGNLTHDAGGTAMTNGKYAIYYIGGLANKTGDDCKLWLNLPLEYYGTLSAAQTDAEGFGVSSVPASLKSCAFLIAKVIVKRAGGGATWTVEDEVDLRGTELGGAAGSGGGGGGSTFSDGVFGIYQAALDTNVMTFDLTAFSAPHSVTVPDSDMTMWSTTGSNATFAGDVNIDNGTLLVDSGSNLVGVNKGVPVYTLDVGATTSAFRVAGGVTGDIVSAFINSSSGAATDGVEVLLQVDPAGGDAWHRFTSNGVLSWSAGLDNTDDAYRICEATSLSTTSVFEIAPSTGLVTIAGNLNLADTLIDVSSAGSGTDNYVLTYDYDGGGSPKISLEAAAGGGGGGVYNYTTRTAVGTLLSTHLNTLTDGSYSAVGVEVDQITDQNIYGDFELYVEYTVAPDTGSSCSLFLVPEVDETTYADGSDTLDPPANYFVGAFPLRDATGVQRIGIMGVKLPSCNFKPVLLNSSGQSTKNDNNNLLKLWAYNIETV